MSNEGGVREGDGKVVITATSAPIPDFSETVGKIINDDEADATVLADIEGSLALWLDAPNINARDNAGISNGDAVSTWGDLSGNGNDVSQSSAANQPSYNGTAIEFSGSHFIQSVNTIDITASAGGESTIFTVLKFDSLGSYGPVYTIEHSSNKGIYHGLYTGTSLGMSITHNRHNNHYEGWDDSKSTWVYTSSAVTSIGQNTIWAISSADGNVDAKINGTNINLNDNYNSNPDVADHAGLFTLGRNDVVGDNYLDGEISEVIVFNKKLSPNQINELNAYLSVKWNLDTIDTDADGFTDVVENLANTSAVDAASKPMIPDFSDTVDAEIGSASWIGFCRSELSLMVGCVKILILGIMRGLVMVMRLVDGWI